MSGTTKLIAMNVLWLWLALTVVVISAHYKINDIDARLTGAMDQGFSQALRDTTIAGYFSAEQRLYERLVSMEHRADSLEARLVHAEDVLEYLTPEGVE